MNIWELLGIEPTEDISKIKSAYARQAKQYHPEEHPEEFKALQGAYKMALQIAKSKKAGITITYTPPARTTGVKTEEAPKAEESEEKRQEAAKTEEPEAERQEAAKTEEPEAERQEAAETEEPEAGRREAAETEEPEVDRPKTEATQEDARGFDFSGVDAYGDRERFLGQFLLLAKNPYVQNRIETWEYFLHLDAYEDLFSNADFRREFVETICGLDGWRRKTILYFERVLKEFQTQGAGTEEGQRETKTRAFRMKKLPRLRLPAICMDRFLLKEGRNFHKQLRTRISKSIGREIDLDVEADLIRYIKLYLSYGEADGAYIERLHRGWRFEQLLVFGLTVVVCFLVIATETGAIAQRRAKESQMDYLLELYGPDLVPESEEEQKEMQREYRAYWKYAEDAMDEALDRYREWK